MSKNFNILLVAVNEARTRSQLELALATAKTTLEIWLNADAINSVEYHAKMAQVSDAYHTQLLEYPALTDALAAVHSKAVSEVHHE